MMNKLRIPVLLSLCFMTASASLAAQETPVLSTDKARSSYAIGLQTAKNLKRDGADVDMDIIIQGLKDGFSGERQLISDKETRQLMQVLMNDARQKMVANKREASVRNRTRGEEFLATNKTREGVNVLPSGVQYRVIRAGSGPMGRCTTRFGIRVRSPPASTSRNSPSASRRCRLSSRINDLKRTS